MKNSNHSIKEMLITVFGELFLLLGITEFLRTNVLSLVIAYIAGIIITFFYMPESDKKYTIQKDFALSPKLRKYLIKVALPPCFSELRGIFFCQIAAIIQVLCIITAAVLKKLYPDRMKVELFRYAITAGVVINLFIFIYMTKRYQEFLKKVWDYNAYRLSLWEPFHKGEKDPECYSVYYPVTEYMDIEAIFIEDYFNKMKFLTDGVFIDDSIFEMFGVKLRKKTSLLTVIFFSELSDEHIQELNTAFSKTITRELNNSMTMIPVYYIYIIVVKRRTPAFEDLIMSKVSQSEGRYLLPVGYIMNENTFYVATPKNEEYIDQYNEMKEEFLDLLEKNREESDAV